MLRICSQYFTHVFAAEPSSPNQKIGFMKLGEIISGFEEKLPLGLQEEWDHCGLNLGSRKQNVTGVLFSYDVCLEAVEFARRHKCQLIVSHHPFRMCAQVAMNLDDYEGRLIAACIQNGIALYSAHTNHDASTHSLNFHYLKKLHTENILPLKPVTEELFKLVVFVPIEHTGKVMDALFLVGAGGIGHYGECSFRASGLGTFKGDNTTHPAIGKKNQRATVSEERVEVLVAKDRINAAINAMRKVHPYEEIAYDIFRLENKRGDVGLGAVGDFESPVTLKQLIPTLKKIFRTRHIRFVDNGKTLFHRIGICTGSGANLIEHARHTGCDLFITGDVKYHQAIDAKRAGLAIADVGHFYSEIDSVKILKTLFADVFGKKLKLLEYQGLRDAFRFL